MSDAGAGAAPAGTNDDWYRFYAGRRIAAMTARQIADDAAAAERDVDAVLARTRLSPAHRILEVGCGWGRHTVALARRGYGRVVSVDIAPECIELARARAATAGLRCEIREQAFGEVQDGPYAAVLSLYDRSVCGFPSEAEDAGASATWAPPRARRVARVRDQRLAGGSAGAGRAGKRRGTASSWSRSFPTR